MRGRLGFPACPSHEQRVSGLDSSWPENPLDGHCENRQWPETPSEGHCENLQWPENPLEATAKMDSGRKTLGKATAKMDSGRKTLWKALRKLTVAGKPFGKHCENGQRPENGLEGHSGNPNDRGTHGKAHLEIRSREEGRKAELSYARCVIRAHQPLTLGVTCQTSIGILV